MTSPTLRQARVLHALREMGEALTRRNLEPATSSPPGRVRSGVARTLDRPSLRAVPGPGRAPSLPAEPDVQVLDDLSSFTRDRHWQRLAAQARAARLELTRAQPRRYSGSAT